jgi:Fic family protein
MRIRIEITEDDGSRTTAEFEGENSIRKAIRFIELAEETSDITPTSTEPQRAMHRESTYSQDTLTLKERLYLFLKYEFPRRWFTSQEIKEGYEAIYGSINLSTVSTYLARLAREGCLEKRGNRINRAYRIIEEHTPEGEKIPI